MNTPETAATGAAVPVGAAIPTVLIIDDDPRLLDLMALMLRDAGFRVLTAPDGPTGLQHLRRAAPAIDAVLLDYQMPDLDGAATLPYVRQIAPAAKLLGVSGTTLRDLPPAFREGVDQFISKPFTRAGLVAAVRDLLAGNSAR